MARKVMGRPRFTALASRIVTELEGRPFKKAIYAKYQAELGFGYRQFLYYVKELERGDCYAQRPAVPMSLSARSAAPAPDPASAERSDSPVREPINARRPEPKRFIFDPTDIDVKKLI